MLVSENLDAVIIGLMQEWHKWMIRLVSSGDFDEMKQLVDAGNDLAADRLAELAANRGDVVTLNFLIDAGSEAGADRLAEIVAAEGDLEELSRLADEGSEVAATLLSALISEAK